MTIIEMKDKTIYVHGHSGYGTYGNDIVCASISTLVESTYYYLEATENKVRFSDGDGEFIIYLDELNESGNKIINSFSDMVNDLISQYPKYLKKE